MAASFQIKLAQELDRSKCNLPQTIPYEGKAICSDPTVTPNFKSWSAINIQDFSVVNGKNLVPVKDDLLHTKIV